MRRSGRWLVTGLVVVLAACGSDIRGSWRDAEGVTTYRFGSDGLATVDVLDASVNAEYRLDGDRVLVTSPQGTVVLTRRDDRLYGPMGQELTRQE